MTSQASPQRPQPSGLDAGTPGDLAGVTGTGLDASPAEPMAQRPLREVVECTMRRYFAHLDGGDVTGLHAMVMAEVEAPLFACVLEHCQGNQTRAAEMLGLNRGTLRKKLKQYDLI